MYDYCHNRKSNCHKCDSIFSFHCLLRWVQIAHFTFSRDLSLQQCAILCSFGVFFMQQSTNKLKLLALATPNNEFRLRANRPVERSKKYCVSESITRLKIHLIQIYLAQIKIFFPPKPKVYAFKTWKYYTKISVALAPPQVAST